MAENTSKFGNRKMYPSLVPIMKMNGLDFTSFNMLMGGECVDIIKESLKEDENQSLKEDENQSLKEDENQSTQIVLKCLPIVRGVEYYVRVSVFFEKTKSGLKQPMKDMTFDVWGEGPTNQVASDATEMFGHPTEFKQITGEKNGKGIFCAVYDKGKAIAVIGKSKSPMTGDVGTHVTLAIHHKRIRNACEAAKIEIEGSSKNKDRIEN